MSFSLDLGFQKAARRREQDARVREAREREIAEALRREQEARRREIKRRREKEKEVVLEWGEDVRPVPEKVDASIVLDRKAQIDRPKASPIWRWLLGLLGWTLLSIVALLSKAARPLGAPEKEVLQALLLLLGMGATLGVLAALTHALRKLKNPLYWQLMCWFLVAIGIILRPFVLDRKDLDIRLSAVAIAGVVAVIVLPLLMRWLNRVKPEPGLIHAALPLSLGVFLDVTQLAAQSYVPKLATYLGL